jgi:hypothetical protein
VFLIKNRTKSAIYPVESSMNTIDACRFCQYYAPEGRRGGHCHKLQVPVSADWSACPLADHPFNSEWDMSLPRLADHANDRTLSHLYAVDNLSTISEKSAILPLG